MWLSPLIRTHTIIVPRWNHIEIDVPSLGVAEQKFHDSKTLMCAYKSMHTHYAIYGNDKSVSNNKHDHERWVWQSEY